jgi:hypothetical protein
MRTDVIVTYLFLYPDLAILASFTVVTTLGGVVMMLLSIRLFWKRQWWSGRGGLVLSVGFFVFALGQGWGTANRAERLPSLTRLAEQMDLAAEYGVDLRNEPDPMLFPASKLAKKVEAERPYAPQVWEILRAARARERCAPSYWTGTQYFERFVFVTDDFSQGPRVIVRYDEHDQARYTGATSGPPDDFGRPAPVSCTPF